MSVVIETTIGDLTVDLYVKERPKCCFNFIKLCKIKYYNSCIFHRIERDFIAQTGDPTGDGSGGCSVFALVNDDKEVNSKQIYFPREVKPKLRHEKKGCLSMVNNGSDLHGSQFFFTLSDALDSLDDGGHTVFGYVAEGLDVISKLNQELCDHDHKPYREIRITHTVILDDPFEDPAKLAIPDRSPSPSESIFESMDKIGIEEDVDETSGKSLTQIEEEIAAKEAAARATILEMVGDLPDADVAPPDNVLFVCKLNPVTRDEDLEVIFSRFGPITSCEVIRDTKTGESLQYAFIEFESAADCEKAYFKMDNVLIDDRRIHVDFSQSVAKFKYIKKNQQQPQQQQPSRSTRDSSPHESKRKPERRHSPNERDRKRHERRHSPYERRRSRSPRDRRRSPHERRHSPNERRYSPYDRNKRKYDSRHSSDDRHKRKYEGRYSPDSRHRKRYEGRSEGRRH